ncbi:MAG: beta-lactamase family protein [Clostridia bacterium]|nr:beta-lactamase family protein [Clostridia bacterium]
MLKLDTKKLAQNISETIHKDIENQEICGASVLVRQNGELLYKDCFGVTAPNGNIPLTEDTVFRMASMTKPITAVATLILVEQGKLKLDDLVSDYLPIFKEQYVAKLENGKVVRDFKAKTAITLRHLLTHTSGIGSGRVYDVQYDEMTPEAVETLDGAISYYANMGLSFEPFTKEEYSGTAAFSILTKIIEMQSGTDYETFLKENIFKPLGMTDTCFVPSDKQWQRMAVLFDKKDGKPCVGEHYENCVFRKFPCTHFLGGAGLISTLSDYDKFAQMLLNGGILKGNRILSEATVKEMATAHVPESIQGKDIRWGLGVRVITGKDVLPKGCFGWSGAFGTHFWVDPENKITVLYMKNAHYDGGAGAKTARNFEKDVYISIK